MSRPPNDRPDKPVDGSTARPVNAIAGLTAPPAPIETAATRTMRTGIRRIPPSKPIFVRNLDTYWSSSTFLVATVTTILAIRFFLYTTGYPQIGGRGLHIAHMLWGGLFMVVALVIFISFLDQLAHRRHCWSPVALCFCASRVWPPTGSFGGRCWCRSSSPSSSCFSMSISARSIDSFPTCSY